MTILERNESVQRHILDPANCHCTYRVITSDKTAEARCNVTNKIRAKMNWRHLKLRTIISWSLPIANTFHKEFPSQATDGLIDETITTGFAEMHEAWQTSEQ